MNVLEDYMRELHDISANCKAVRATVRSLAEEMLLGPELDASYRTVVNGGNKWAGSGMGRNSLKRKNPTTGNLASRGAFRNVEDQLFAFSSPMRYNNKGTKPDHNRLSKQRSAHE